MGFLFRDKGYLISHGLTLALLVVVGGIGARYGYGGWKVLVTLVSLGGLLWLYLALGLTDLGDEWSRRLSTPAARLRTGLVLLVPYLVYGVGTGTFQVSAFFRLAAFVLVPLLVLSLPLKHRQRPTWMDTVAILAIWMPIEFRLLKGAWMWPKPDISNVFNVLLAVDVGVIGFVVFRGLKDVGYRFRLDRSGLKVALLSFGLFLVIALPLGLATGFLAFKPRLSVFSTMGLAVGLFLATGIPEELLFRGIIQNLLEKTLGRRWVALGTASVIFGVAHLNSGDWRYFVLATIAGLFYGWTYQRTGGLTAPAITHALVDAVWSGYLRR
jgi:hypothetical protein